MKSNIANSLVIPKNSFFQRKYIKLNTSSILQKPKKEPNTKNKASKIKNNKSLFNEINTVFGEYQNNVKSTKNSANKKINKKTTIKKNDTNKIKIPNKLHIKIEKSKIIEQDKFFDNTRHTSSNISNGAKEQKTTEKNVKTVLNESENDNINNINKLSIINIKNKLSSINEVEEELLYSIKPKLHKLEKSKKNKKNQKDKSIKKISTTKSSRNITRNFLTLKEKESNDIFNINNNNINNQISKISKFSQENNDIVNYKTPEKSSIYVLTKSANSNNISFNIINNSNKQTINFGEGDYVSSNNSNFINKENALSENQKNCTSKEMKSSEIQKNNINNGSINNSKCLTLTNISKLTNFLSENDMCFPCSKKNDENVNVKKSKKNDKKYKKKIIIKKISFKEKNFDDFNKHISKEKNNNSEIKTPNKYFLKANKINIINNNFLNYKKYVNHSHSNVANTTIKISKKNYYSSENNKFTKKDNSKYTNIKKSIINSASKKIIYKRKCIKLFSKNKNDINVSDSNSQINKIKKTDYVKKLIHGVYDEINLCKINIDLEKKNVLYSSPNKNNKNCSLVQIMKKNNINNNEKLSSLKLSERKMNYLYSMPKKNSSSVKFINRSCINSEKNINIKNKIKKSDSCRNIKIRAERLSNFDVLYSEKMDKKHNDLLTLRKNKTDFSKFLSFRKIICKKNSYNNLKFVNYYKLLKKNL